MLEQAEHSNHTALYKEGIPLQIVDDDDTAKEEPESDGQDESKQHTTDEGKEEEDYFPVSKAIQGAQIPEEVEDRVQETLDHAYRLHGHYFKNRSDCDYFNMLPFSKEVKKDILEKAIKYELEKKAISVQ